MCQAQRQFDRAVMPVCPEQLSAPLLHQLLNHAPLQPYIYGGKGSWFSRRRYGSVYCQRFERVGIQAIAIIRRDFDQMHCYVLES